MRYAPTPYLVSAATGHSSFPCSDQFPGVLFGIPNLIVYEVEAEKLWYGGAELGPKSRRWFDSQAASEPRSPPFFFFTIAMSSYSYYSSTSSASDERFSRDKEHIVTIDLASDQIIHAVKRTTTANFKGTVKYSQDENILVASTIHSDGNEINLRLITHPVSETSEAKQVLTHDRWM